MDSSFVILWCRCSTWNTPKKSTFVDPWFGVSRMCRHAILPNMKLPSESEQGSVLTRLRLSTI